MTTHADIIIVGGGMVGAALTSALAPLGLRIALIEAVLFDSAVQPSFDERTTALSNGSRRVLETLGIWAAVAPAATAIVKIHVSDQGRFGFARIDAAEQDLSAMGYVVPNRALGAALWSHIMSLENVMTFTPASVAEVVRHADAVEVVLNGAERQVVRAPLIVAADGIASVVRSAFGIEAQVREYDQTAIITTILPQRPHNGVAYERFTDSGPLALLPTTEGRCTLVLTLKRDRVAQALQWSDAEFLQEVQQRFGFRLGRFIKVGRRVPYPLSLTQAAKTSAKRCVIVGNAAQGLHPVAGMGFNLGLRDVACLAELIAEQRAAGCTDCGTPQLLAAYDAWRAADRGGIIAFTDGLVRLFATPLRSVQRLRNLGLLAFDLLPPAKTALSRLSTGAHRRVPKLARGVPLTSTTAE